MIKSFSKFLSARKYATNSRCGYRWQPKLYSTTVAAQISLDSPYFLSDSATLFHDGATSEIQLVHHDHLKANSTPLHIKTSNFLGSFISLVIDLPTSIISPINNNIIIDAHVISSNQTSAFLRINQQVGENVWRVEKEFIIHDQLQHAIFDLRNAPNLSGKFWIDFILIPQKDVNFWVHSVSIGTCLRPIF